MKNSIQLRSVLPVLALAFLLTSCFYSEEDSIRFVNEFPAEGVSISTLQPDLESDMVTFRGNLEVRSTENNAGIEYGFMFYNPSDPSSAASPERIVVGRTNETTDFSVGVPDLPGGENFVVCAFVAVRQMDDMIGDEIPFTVPE